MRAWRSLIPSFPVPVLSLATAACLLFALAAFVLAATPTLVNAETVGTRAFAAFAVNSNDVVIAGTVVGASDGLLGVEEANGQAPVAFPLANDAVLSRDGRPVTLGELRQGDHVRLTVNHSTGEALAVAAMPGSTGRFQPSSGAAALAALGLIAAAALLIVRERGMVHTAAAASMRLPRTGLSGLTVSLAGPSRTRRSEFTA